MAESKAKEAFPSEAKEYEIYIPEIGKGAFALVYRGRIKGTNQEVAIKSVNLEDQSASMDEVRKEMLIMRRLQHPRVVSVHTAFVEGTYLWIVMPLLTGGSCAAIIKRTHPNGFKDEVLLATILKSCVEGLIYFHKDGLIHRDIKAGNILIGMDGNVQLADFGVAGRLIDDGDKKNSVRTFTGTPCWMAPEVMEQTYGYGVSCDIWSLGITAMELAFGKAPYANYQPMKILLMTLQEEPPTFKSYVDQTSKFSDSFKKMVALCLKKDPAKRPTASALLKHAFFKKAQDEAYVKKELLKNILHMHQDHDPPVNLKQKIEDDEKNQVKQPKWPSWVFDEETIAALKDREATSQQPGNIAAATEAVPMPPPDEPEQKEQKHGRFASTTKQEYYVASTPATTTTASPPPEVTQEAPEIQDRERSFLCEDEDLAEK